MNPWIAIIGIAVIVIAGVLGLVAGAVDETLDPNDPEMKAEIERRRAQEARKKAWKDKFK